MRTAAISLAAFAATADAALNNAAVADPMWKAYNEFKRKFEVEFESMEEDAKRFLIFKENMFRAEGMTKRSAGKTKFGMTKFAHLTAAEFKNTYLGYKPNPKSKELLKKWKKNVKKSVTAESKDWRGTGAVTPVKDQGQCGSCWAFSATQAAETGYWFGVGEQKILAPQQITSCDNQDYGCGGGDTPSAYEYMREAGGVEEESDYPYMSGWTGMTGRCKSNPADFEVKVGATNTIATGAEDESAMLTEIQSTPMSICVDAEPWQMYVSGVIDSSTCGDQLDHCVHLVGYKGGSDNYWIVKNSWAADWGMDGYIMVRQGENACGIADEATTVSAGKEDASKGIFV